MYEIQVEERRNPTRTAIAKRLRVSRTVVSQRIAQMHREGLVAVSEDDRVQLTSRGRMGAELILRKHRLAECLLVDIIGLDWELAHVEASRWQHVLGDGVERHLLNLLYDPTVSPFGNPIPGLGDLDPARFGEQRAASPAIVRLLDAARGGVGWAWVCQISEAIQPDHELLGRLRAADVLPGRKVELHETDTEHGTVRVSAHRGELVLSQDAAAAIFVRAFRLR